MDTGKILVQNKVSFDNEDTLRTSYNKLQSQMVDMFIENWPEIATDLLKPQAQIGCGSFHLLKDKAQYRNLMTNGWDTRIIELQGKAIGN